MLLVLVLCLGFPQKNAEVAIVNWGMAIWIAKSGIAIWGIAKVNIAYLVIGGAEGPNCAAMSR